MNLEHHEQTQMFKERRDGALDGLHERGAEDEGSDGDHDQRDDDLDQHLPQLLEVIEKRHLLVVMTALLRQFFPGAKQFCENTFHDCVRLVSSSVDQRFSSSCRRIGEGEPVVWRAARAVSTLRTS